MSTEKKPTKLANRKAKVAACWFDPLLAKYSDRKLAFVVGTTEKRIAYRRKLFGLDAHTVKQAIEPYSHLLGVESDMEISRLSGASVRSVRDYRQSQSIPPRHVTFPKTQLRKLWVGHPLRPYKKLFGNVSDEDISRVSGIDLEEIIAIRESLGFEAVDAFVEPAAPVDLEDYHGPLLGFESMLVSLSSAKISRATGIPIDLVEQRRKFLGVAYQRKPAKAGRYAHLFGKVPNTLLARLAGVSATRIADMRKATKS